MLGEQADNSVVIAEVEEGTGGTRVMDGDLTWSREHTTGTDDVMHNFVPETCTHLSASVTPVKAIQMK